MSEIDRAVDGTYEVPGSRLRELRDAEAERDRYREALCSDEAVEWAAAAIHLDGTYWPEGFVKPPWEELSDRDREDARRIARAVLGALRALKPTDPAAAEEGER